MAKKLSSVLGVDIGSRTIKVCEVKSQGKQAAVTALSVVDTPEGAVDHSGIYNSDAVGQALKAAIGAAGASAGAMVISIAGQNSVLVRTLEVPKMNPQELKDHMAWEINRNIPFAESTVVSDFKPLGGDDPASPNMDVVMAIAPQSAIDTIIAVAKRAGKQAAAIDVQPLSLARTLETSYGDEFANKTVCVVDLGASSCSINIFHGSRLLMPRQIPLGGDMFTKQIADAMTLPLTDAETAKQTRLVIPENAVDLRSNVVNPFDVPGVPTQEFQPYNPFSDDPAASTPAEAPPVETAPVPSNSDPMFDAIAPLLDEFVSEIRRSVDYFRSRGGNIDQILLAGGGSKIKGLREFVGQSLGVPCDAYDPFRRLNVNAKKAGQEFVDEHRSEFAVAIGNGLHILFD